MTRARWHDVDTAGYSHRFTFDVKADRPLWNPTWSEIEDALGKRLSAPAAASPLVKSRHVEIMRRIYRGSGSTPTATATAPDVDTQFTPDDALSGYDPSSGDTREFARRAIAIRRGSAKFRGALVEAYGSACAITGYVGESALEAAHIDPYRGEHTDHVQNGLLLRADIHTLFDLFELTVDDEYRVVLSPELRRHDYAYLHGTRINRPAESNQWPSLEALRRHRADCPWYS